MPNQSGFQHSMTTDASMPASSEEDYKECDRRHDTLEFRKIMELKTLTVVELIERANKDAKLGRQLQAAIFAIARHELNKEENDLYDDYF